MRAGTSCRFLLSVEGSQALRVTSRESMMFPAHEVTGGLIGLAALSDEQVGSLYAAERYSGRAEARPDLALLLRDLAAVRRTGVAVNLERSERGLAAVSVPLRDQAGDTEPAVSLSIPAARYQPEQVDRVVAALEATAKAISRELA